MAADTERQQHYDNQADDTAHDTANNGDGLISVLLRHLC